MPCDTLRSYRRTSRSGSGYGSGFSSTSSITEKTAVLAPITSASASRQPPAGIVEHQRTLTGTIHLGGGMTGCLHVFPSLLKEFRKRHPRVEIKLTTGGTPQLVEKLRSGAIDVALLTLPVDGLDL